MVTPPKICFAASEAAPYAKTGGLADVAGALPRELRRQGLDVRLFLPLYAQVDRSRHALAREEAVREISIDLAGQTHVVSLWTTRAPDSDLPVHLVDCPRLFERGTLYTSDADEPQRFAVFSRAVIESCQRLAWAPDIFHCHDWHTALIPLFLKSLYSWDALFARSRTILTIHNIGYQGVFPATALDQLGLSGVSPAPDDEELRAGRFGFLRTGLEQADTITTVSPTYAREIQTPEYGMGLEKLLQKRSGELVGILNGVDYGEWSPERDRWIPHRYSRNRLAGKAKNKAYLLRALELDPEPQAPLLGIVSRLVQQKGFELCVPVLPALLETTDLRLVVLGLGEPAYEKFFEGLQRRHPRRARFTRGHDEELAHLIEAGADLFLMPSRYEPCGLNQMFSLRYGTIPVVRRTGGLADSVEPYEPATGGGTGFVFGPFKPEPLRAELERALETHRDRSAWSRLVANAMARDFSWKTQARRYVELYAGLIGR
jgi:starch synthase